MQNFQVTLYIHRNDPSLSKDDVDIKYSNYLNSCRVPRVRKLEYTTLFATKLTCRRHTHAIYIERD